MPQETGDQLALESDVRARAGTTPGEPTHDIFDREALLARVGGDAALLAAMASLFLEECPRYIASIREAVAGGDARALEGATHALKGSVSNFTAHRAVQAAQRLELMGRDGNLTESAQALRELEVAIGRVRVAIRELT